jgi:hypothetical protein
VATRDGDASVYQLDTEAVKALRQAAADVKEDASNSKDSKGGGKK